MFKVFPVVQLYQVVRVTIRLVRAPRRRTSVIGQWHSYPHLGPSTELGFIAAASSFFTVLSSHVQSVRRRRSSASRGRTAVCVFVL